MPLSAGLKVMIGTKAFLQNAYQSGLLTREQLREGVQSVPPDRREDPQAVADHFVRAGQLSRFQAQQILRGKPRGLVVASFQILTPIAKGGMGLVYLARDTRTGELAALKVLPSKAAKQEERLLTRFLREMVLSKRLGRHPNIVTSYEAGFHHGLYFIAMEYVPGTTLSKMVRKDGPLPLGRAAHLFSEVATGLKHAHRRGLIHRDIKPGNIMVTPDDHAKLLDFGLALVKGESEVNEVVGGPRYAVGTLDYIAPEQAVDSTKVDERADLYGLGCCLYFALTGRPPFPGGTKKEKVRRHVFETAVPVGQLVPGLPPAFVAFLERLMAKKPSARYESAEIVRDLLLMWAA
jgi:serine/threonine protein kinase